MLSLNPQKYKDEYFSGHLYSQSIHGEVEGGDGRSPSSQAGSPGIWARDPASSKMGHKDQYSRRMDSDFHT